MLYYYIIIKNGNVTAVTQKEVSDVKQKYEEHHI